MEINTLTPNVCLSLWTTSWKSYHDDAEIAVGSLLGGLICVLHLVHICTFAERCRTHNLKSTVGKASVLCHFRPLVCIIGYFLSLVTINLRPLYPTYISSSTNESINFEMLINVFTNNMWLEFSVCWRSMLNIGDHWKLQQWILTMLHFLLLSWFSMAAVSDVDFTIGLPCRIHSLR